MTKIKSVTDTIFFRSFCYFRNHISFHKNIAHSSLFLLLHRLSFFKKKFFFEDLIFKKWVAVCKPHFSMAPGRVDHGEFPRHRKCRAGAIFFQDFFFFFFGPRTIITLGLRHLLNDPKFDDVRSRDGHWYSFLKCQWAGTIFFMAIIFHTLARHNFCLSCSTLMYLLKWNFLKYFFGSLWRHL